MAAPSGIKVLLVIGGGIAAYKSCELIRLIRKNGGSVTCVLTEGGAHFVTPMTLAALSENPVHTTLWDLRNEVEMGHIQLSREADLVVVCPATANMLAKMAAGIADDLATTLLLATDKPVMAVPAMNVRMWSHAAVQANVARLREAGVIVLDPDEGPMACGEYGAGRLPEPPAIWDAIASWAGQDTGTGTRERESQGGLGGLIASLIPRGGRKAAPQPDTLLAEKGGAAAVRESLPADIAIMAAAVADWRTRDMAGSKMKKRGDAPPALELAENPDILATLGASDARPGLLIGFAAETDDVVENAQAKRARKKADWIIANDVSGGVGQSVMGGAHNTIHLVTEEGVEDWPQMPKEEVAMRLVERIALALENDDD